ncbi:MAG: AAA family ATPase [Magnetococcales bacterium]|nr:AAA family ATPase [Magnetococcales bacterium]
MNDQGNRNLPLSLKEFEITNFQCVQHTVIRDLPQNAPWIMMTGENGDGKTSLLQALAIAMYNTNWNFSWHEKTNSQFLVNVKIQTSLGRILSCQFGADRNNYSGRSLDIDNDNLDCLVSHDRDVSCSDQIFGYGASRLSIQGEMSAERKKTMQIDNLLNQGGPLYNVERWLKDLELDARGDPVLQARNRRRMDLLAALMPNVDRIELDGSKVSYLEKGVPVPAHHLSAGHKSILAMIGDLLIRFADGQPGVEDPKDYVGIVLIDELEAHLHPKWQRQFPRKLSEVFPGVQFIATTHSVLPFMGAPAGSVFLRVIRDAEHGTRVERLDIDVTRLLPNALLTSPLFDLDVILNPSLESMDLLETEDSFAEIERQREQKRLLDRFAHEQAALLARLSGCPQDSP